MNRNLSQWIESHAAFVPSKTAIRFEGHDISYFELLVRVQNTVGLLKNAHGVSRGERIAYLGLNSPELLILLFACARLGAMLLPLNWRLAMPELEYILDNAAPRLLVCDEEYFPVGEKLCGKRSGRTLCGHDHLAAEHQDCHFEWTDPQVGPASPMLLVYTSGTTGRPKGAVLTQEAVLFNALNSVHMHDLDPSDHILTVLPMFHVGGLNIQTTPALYVGATVTLHRRFDPGAVLSDIQALSPTRLVLVPATIMALAADPQWTVTDLSSVRSVTTGSTIVPHSIIALFHDRAVPVIQNYGLTETGPVALYLRVDDAFGHVGSTGRGALHTRLRIVNEEGDDVACGESGELLLQGPNVLREYWGDPMATEKAFHEGWFRTGDVGYQDDEGYVYINDRKTDVVISGSENIYPAELEQVLDTVEGLAEATVVGMPDPRWGEVPVALVVLEPGVTFDKQAILSFFEDRLARFKHPKAVIQIDMLPRNVMGKVLKHELRAKLADGTLAPS